MDTAWKKTQVVLVIAGWVSVVALAAGLGQAKLVWANPQELVVLSDEELSQVSAGDYAVDLKDFNVLIHQNEADSFTMDIAQGAFHNAQGVFTTLQTVNSAIDLNLVVNIYFSQVP